MKGLLDGHEFLSFFPLPSGLSLLYPTHGGSPSPPVPLLLLYICFSSQFLHPMLVPQISTILLKTHVGSLPRLISPTEMDLSPVTASTSQRLSSCCVMTVHRATHAPWKWSLCLRPRYLCIPSSPCTVPGKQVSVYCWLYLLLSCYIPCLFPLPSRLCLYSLYFICRDIHPNKQMK